MLLSTTISTVSTLGNSITSLWHYNYKYKSIKNTTCLHMQTILSQSLQSQIERKGYVYIVICNLIFIIRHLTHYELWLNMKQVKSTVLYIKVPASCKMKTFFWHALVCDIYVFNILCVIYYCVKESMIFCLKT